ncbi:MAG: endonuclease MutS2 [Clostridia bacterium]|nr:endonuclease MutS2 [Clostridia bacterium]
MILDKTLTSLEYNKILNLISNYCVLNETKRNILNEKPEVLYSNAKFLLEQTNEAYKLIFIYGSGNVQYFEELFDETERAKRGGTLTMQEILKINALLRSSRIMVTSINEVTDDEIVILRDLTKRIYFDKYLENEISTKIISPEQMADTASEKLYQIRKNIKILNEKIREKLLGYMRTGLNNYLQDNVVSIRNGRYVVPVKAEHKNHVNGFVHDRSASGSTVFIEPIEVLELNNDLKQETINEKLEIERILQEISSKIGLIADKLDENVIYLSTIDKAYAKATFAHKTRSIMPNLNANGVIKIVNGRHPLIDKDRVVPINIELGAGYNFILVSGPNTGGKTVTLKLTGLLTLMAMSGIFVPCGDGTELSVFESVFVDIGDEQSIENSLSTFSSHLKNVINITENANENSLILIDEIGAGTDPEEGSALAESILENLISKNSKGVVTTHYTSLKEFAFTDKRIINASMEFNDETYAPLFKLKVGMPGTSNAIEIAKRLGLDNTLIKRAKSLLSAEKTNFDAILLEAEKIRKLAESERNELKDTLENEKKVYAEIKLEKEKLEKDKEKFMVKAKAESRKLINQKLEVAEELLAEMKDIFAKETYTDADLVKMSTLKNKIANSTSALNESLSDNVTPYKNVDIKTLKVGDKVYVNSLANEGTVSEININKRQIWVFVGSLRVNVKEADLKFIEKSTKKPLKTEVSFKRSTNNNAPIKLELNVIGYNVDDALNEVALFIDKSVTSNLEEVRIVHGKGLRILSKAIQNYLKTNVHVESFRFGKYGEGEDGVTIVKLK